MGILEQQIWTRPVKSPKKKKNQREKKSIFNKESKRWLTGLVSAELGIPTATTVVTVTDRDSSGEIRMAISLLSFSGLSSE